MKNINETVKSKYLIYILFIAGGLLLGWLLFHNSDTDSHTSQASETGTVVHSPHRMGHFRSSGKIDEDCNRQYPAIFGRTHGKPSEYLKLLN